LHYFPNDFPPKNNSAVVPTVICIPWDARAEELGGSETIGHGKETLYRFPRNFNN